MPFLRFRQCNLGYIYGMEAAVRVYRSTDNGGWTFCGVAIILGKTSDEILFRWAASKIAHRVSMSEWEKLKKEESNFKVCLKRN